MTYHVRLTDAASSHIDQAAEWWAEHHSLEQSLRWLREIHAEIATIADLADKLPLARESSRFPFAVRELHFGVGRRPTHRVLFRLVGEVAEVLMVRHVAQRQIRPHDL